MISISWLNIPSNPPLSIHHHQFTLVHPSSPSISINLFMAYGFVAKSASSKFYSHLTIIFPIKLVILGAPFTFSHWPRGLLQLLTSVQAVLLAALSWLRGHPGQAQPSLRLRCVARAVSNGGRWKVDLINWNVYIIIWYFKFTWKIIYIYIYIYLYIYIYIYLFIYLITIF